MKTRIELISEDQPEEIVVRCYQITEEIQNMISFIENDKKIIGYKRETAYHLKMSDIYYFEIVDQKAFIYCEKDIYESKMKL